MSTLSKIARNIVSNLTGFAFQIVITLYLTPFILSTLGNTTYGIWALITGLTGYYGLLDFGFRAGLTQYITRYKAEGEFDKINETASAGFVVLGGCALVLLLATFALAFSAELLFKLPAESRAEVRAAIVIVGCGISLQFLFSPFSVVFPATQRFDISNAIGIGTRILSAILTVIALNLDYGLVGLSAAVMLSNLVDYLLRWFISYKLLPTLRVTPRLARLKSAWELAQYGIWNVAASGSVRLISYSDAVVIAVFLPPAAITPFVLAASLTEYFLQLFVPIGYVFFPAVTELDAKGDEEGVRTMFLNGSRLLASLAIPAGLISYLLADDFLRLWIGEAVAEGEYPSAASLFSVLLVATVFNSMQRVSYQIFLGTRLLPLMTKIFLSEALSNIVLSVILVQSMGLFGVAIGTLVPAIMMKGIVLPMIVCRLYRISGFEYVKSVYLRPSIITVILAPPVLAIIHFNPPADWVRLSVDGCLTGVVALILIVLMGLTKDERTRYIWPRLEVLRNRFG